METSKRRCFPGFNIFRFLDQYFFIHINDICSNLSTNVKLFTDYTSVFSIMNDANESFRNLSSNDLCIISN